LPVYNQVNKQQSYSSKTTKIKIITKL